MVSEIKARNTLSLARSQRRKKKQKKNGNPYLVVSLALMAVFKSVRIVAIRGGSTGPVEFHLTRRAGRRTGRATRIDRNMFN